MSTLQSLRDQIIEAMTGNAVYEIERAELDLDQYLEAYAKDTMDKVVASFKDYNRGQVEGR